MVVREPSRLWTVMPGVLIGCNSGQKSIETAKIIAAVWVRGEHQGLSL